jgi:hypothetical protein
MTTVDDQIIARARRRLLPPGEHTEWDQQNAARAALDVITAGVVAQADAELAVFAALDMPAWNEPSGPWPVITAGPLLELLEEATT